MAGDLRPSRASLRRQGRPPSEPRAVGQTGPGFFDASPRGNPEPWTPPDAPEASNRIHGSFDSPARTRHQRSTHPPPSRGARTVTASLIGQQKIARTDGADTVAATVDNAVPALLVEGVTKRFVVGRKRKPVVAIGDVS